MYFEFDEVRRVHLPYEDPFHRTDIFSLPYFNSPFLNWKRGFYAAATGALTMETVNHVYNHQQLFSKYYMWPKTRQEYNIYFKEITKMEGFYPELFKKLSFGLIFAAGDLGPKFAMWQLTYGGTTSPADYMDPNAIKNLTCAVTTALLTCFNAVPIDNARRAYFADKTWPVELRRGYGSPISALVRIPFEEGPGYLFRGAFPLAMHSFMFWSSYLSFYSWLKDKMYFLWMYHGFSYNYIKTLNLVGSFTLASIIAYPAYYTREMVDLWPKERGGHCSFNGNYRQAYKMMIDNIDSMYYNYLTNYWTWFRRYGASIMIATWVADNYGMFVNNMDPFHSLETDWAMSQESI